jgi:carboxymethylenebutenolidase
MLVLETLNKAEVKLNWVEVNGAHAFLRDEGVRYDPELARSCFGMAVDLFRRAL